MWKLLILKHLFHTCLNSVLSATSVPTNPIDIKRFPFCVKHMDYPIAVPSLINQHFIVFMTTLSPPGPPDPPPPIMPTIKALSVLSEKVLSPVVTSARRGRVKNSLRDCPNNSINPLQLLRNLNVIYLPSNHSNIRQRPINKTPEVIFFSKLSIRPVKNGERELQFEIFCLFLVALN